MFILSLPILLILPLALPIVVGEDAAADPSPAAVPQFAQVPSVLANAPPPAPRPVEGAGKQESGGDAVLTRVLGTRLGGPNGPLQATLSFGKRGRSDDLQTRAILSGRSPFGGFFRRRFNATLNGGQQQQIAVATQEVKKGKKARNVEKEQQVEETADEEAIIDGAQQTPNGKEEQKKNEDKKRDELQKGQQQQLVVRVSGGRVILGRKGDADECSDRAENCAENADFCVQQAYIQLMTENCARTCGQCKTASSFDGDDKESKGGWKQDTEKEQRDGSEGRDVAQQASRDVEQVKKESTSEDEKREEDGSPAKTTEQCHDLSSRCQQWAQRGFCTSRFFHRDLKARFCANSCGLCDVAAKAEGGE